eukprot:jgi/Tetstr1/458160/TSEL_044651.t1
MTPQLRRDLQWWTSVPISQSNGKPIHRPVETAYPHTDSSGYGRFGPHSIDRFASALKTLLPRYNAALLDPKCEAADSLHLPDADWRRENNWVRKGLAASQDFAGGRVPAARWAINQREGQAKWTADTLTSWLQLVIGVTMQKIKYFGGWAMEFSVVLDYIDPTVMPCPVAWHLFGWMTPWGGQPSRLPRQVAT